MSNDFAVADSSAIISYYLGNKSASFAAVQHLLLQRRLIASSKTFSGFREVLLREKFNRISIAKRLSFIAAYGKR